DVVIREGRGSVSLLQRALGIGYGRAARLVDFMAEDGIVGDYNGSQAREVLLTLEQWATMSGQAEPTAKSPSTSAPTAAAASKTQWVPPERPTALSVASMPKVKRNRILPEPDEEEQLGDELDDEVAESADTVDESQDEDSFGTDADADNEDESAAEYDE